MTSKQLKIIKIEYAILGVLLAGLVYLFWPGFDRTNYIDCRSGRVLREVRFLGVLINRDVEETEFSRIVADQLDDNSTPEWHPYLSWSRFQPISPHYYFHSVPHNLQTLVKQLRTANLSEVEIKSRCLEAFRMLADHDLQRLNKYCTTLYVNED